MTVLIAQWIKMYSKLGGVILPWILLHGFKLLSCKELKIIEHNALVRIITVKSSKTLHFLIVHIEYVHSVLQTLKLLKLVASFIKQPKEKKKLCLHIGHIYVFGILPLRIKENNYTLVWPLKPRLISYTELNETEDKINQHYNIWMCMHGTDCMLPSLFFHPV